MNKKGTTWQVKKMPQLGLRKTNNPFFKSLNSLYIKYNFNEFFTHITSNRGTSVKIEIQHYRIKMNN